MEKDNGELDFDGQQENRRTNSNCMPIKRKQWNQAGLWTTQTVKPWIWRLER